MSENTMLAPQMGINMEQATANCEELAKAIHEITAGVLTTVNSFCRWIQRVAAEVADDRAEIAAAVKVAKAFRDKLEAAGISYHKLLALEEARRDMNDLAHHILLGWENGEGFPHE